MRSSNSLGEFRLFFISKMFTEPSKSELKLKKSGVARFSTSTTDDVVDLPSSKKTADYTLH